MYDKYEVSNFIRKEKSKHLLRSYSKNSHFSFDDKAYMQNDGIVFVFL